MHESDRIAYVLARILKTKIIFNFDFWFLVFTFGQLGDVMLLTSILLSYVSSALSNFSIVFGHHSSKFNLNEICLLIVQLSYELQIRGNPVPRRIR